MDNIANSNRTSNIHVDNLIEHNYIPVDKNKQLIVHPVANNKYSIGYDPCNNQTLHSTRRNYYRRNFSIFFPLFNKL